MSSFGSPSSAPLTTIGASSAVSPSLPFDEKLKPHPIIIALEALGDVDLTNFVFIFDLDRTTFVNTEHRHVTLKLDRESLLKNFKNAEVQEAIWRYIKKHRGTIGIATFRTLYEIYAPKVAEQKTVRLPSGEEAVISHLQALFGADWDKIIPRKLIRAFYVLGKEAYEKFLAPAKSSAVAYFGSESFNPANTLETSSFWKEIDMNEVTEVKSHLRNGQPVLRYKGTHIAEIEQACDFIPKFKVFFDDGKKNCFAAKWMGCKVIVANPENENISHLEKLPRLIKYLMALPSPENAITFFKKEIEKQNFDLHLIFIKSIIDDDDKAAIMKTHAEMLNWRGLFLQQHGETEAAIKYFAKALSVINLFGELYDVWRDSSLRGWLVFKIDLLKSCITTNYDKANAILKTKTVTPIVEGKAEAGESKDMQAPTQEAAIEFLAKQGLDKEKFFFLFYLKDNFNTFDEPEGFTLDGVNALDGINALVNQIAMLDWWRKLLNVHKDLTPLILQFELAALELEEILRHQLKRKHFYDSLINDKRAVISDEVRKVENSIKARKLRLGIKTPGESKSAITSKPQSGSVDIQDMSYYLDSTGKMVMVSDDLAVAATKAYDLLTSIGPGLGGLSAAIKRHPAPATSASVSPSHEVMSTGTETKAAATESPSSPSPNQQQTTKNSVEQKVENPFVQMDLEDFISVIGDFDIDDLRNLQPQFEAARNGTQGDGIQIKLEIVLGRIQELTRPAQRV